MKIDKFLFSIILILTFWGLITFYGIYRVLSFKNPYLYGDIFLKFLLGNIFFPFLFFFIFSLFSWQFIKKITLPFFIISLIFVLLAFLPFFQLPNQPTARWFYFKNFSFQPTEFLKISTLLLIAFLVPFFKKSKDYFLISLAIIVFCGFLIYKQPALTNLIIFISAIVGGFLGLKFSLRHILIISLLILIIFLIGLTQEFRLKRILGILMGEDLTIAYQLKQARLAISSGGLFGKGLGNSQFKLIGIPLMITDSIFAIVAEETGFIGSLILISLYLALVFQIFNLSRHISNEEKKFFGYGLGTMISAQVFIHIASNTILTTGVPLPFFSYGPSNAIALMIGLGIINSLKYS